MALKFSLFLIFSFIFFSLFSQELKEKELFLIGKSTPAGIKLRWYFKDPLVFQESMKSFVG